VPHPYAKAAADDPATALTLRTSDHQKVMKRMRPNG
jgi:hypothetical protein